MSMFLAALALSAAPAMTNLPAAPAQAPMILAESDFSCGNGTGGCDVRPDRPSRGDQVPEERERKRKKDCV